MHSPATHPSRSAQPTQDLNAMMNIRLVRADRCHHSGLNPNRLQHLLRPGPKPVKAGGDSLTAPHDKKWASTEDSIVCRQCLHEITSSTQRTMIDGAHAHTFANPEGIVFEIVCYRNASGCAYIGPRSPEFTWFAGYVWRIAVCANCLVHLGWRFSAPQGNYFHGLIANRLTGKDV